MVLRNSKFIIYFFLMKERDAYSVLILKHYLLYYVFYALDPPFPDITILYLLLVSVNSC